MLKKRQLIQPVDWSLFVEQFRLYIYLLGAYSKFLTVGKCLGFPFVVQIQTQSSCNGACLACPYPILRGKLSQGAMEWDLFARIADQLALGPLPFRVSLFLQNEPLLDRRIFDWVRYFKTRAPNKICRVVTNGELLDRFSPSDIIGSRLDQLTISLNAHYRETYELVNTGLSYEKVMANVESLLSNGELRRRVKLSFLVTQQNQDEVHQATRYWKSRGVKVQVKQVTNRAGALEGFESIRPGSPCSAGSVVSRLLESLMSRARRVAGCTLPFCQMNILFNGDCIVCCHDWKRASVVGNATTTALREIWNNERMNEIRRLVRRKEYEGIDPCKECSVAR